jgi:hypothetical protein
MGTTLRRNWKAFLLVSAASFFALAYSGCRDQTQQANQGRSASAPASPAPSAAQIVIPPWPSTFPTNGFPASASISGNIPLAVPLPDDIGPTDQVRLRPYFDYFSWQSFIALNWPATAGSRGVPDQPDNANVFLKAASATPVVWGTYKETFELFGQKDQRPTPWESYDMPVNPCPGTQGNQKSLILVSKGDTTLDGITQAFSYPLIDQNNNYVSYEVRYNQAQYNFVRGDDKDQSSWLYFARNLQPKEPVQMPISSPATPATPASTNSPATPATPATLGAMMLKASWRIKTDKDDVSRYYTTQAQVLDPTTQKCTQQQVLLVGLHIAHKVAPFTEWVWSTFEQVDNVPPDSSGGSGAPPPSPPPNGYSFNNGTNTPATVGGFANRPPMPAPTLLPVAQRSPVQVTRLNPIPDTPQGASTRDMNAFYQQLLKGTVWQYYQLVMTQWPFSTAPLKTLEQGGIYPRDAGGAFPVNGVINTTMETYFQSPNDAAGAGGNSCMSCHFRAGQSDFSWGLMRRAH